MAFGPAVAGLPVDAGRENAEHRERAARPPFRQLFAFGIILDDVGEKFFDSHPATHSVSLAA